MIKHPDVNQKLKKKGVYLVTRGNYKEEDFPTLNSVQEGVKVIARNAFLWPKANVSLTAKYGPPITMLRSWMLVAILV